MEKNKNWTVLFSAVARRNFASIVKFLLESEGVDFAQSFADAISGEAESRLKTLPLRGRPVPELERLNSPYREIRMKSYRLIYNPIAERRLVEIMLIVHERRDIRDLLAGMANKKSK